MWDLQHSGKIVKQPQYLCQAGCLLARNEASHVLIEGCRVIPPLSHALHFPSQPSPSDY